MMKTVEVTTPSELEIVVTRTFRAPAALVFDYHTRPEHVRQWLLGPPGWSMPVCEIDLRVGGRYRYLWREAGRGAEFGVSGEFRAIDAPRRIVHTETLDGTPGDVWCTLTLMEVGDRTTLTMAMAFPSRSLRDQALKSGMTDGTAASYDRLEEMMALTPRSSGGA
jgi:uncharacterized protein YndB with AHSA1/START domain